LFFHLIIYSGILFFYLIVRWSTVEVWDYHTDESLIVAVPERRRAESERCCAVLSHAEVVAVLEEKRLSHLGRAGVVVMPEVLPCLIWPGAEVLLCRSWGLIWSGAEVLPCRSWVLIWSGAEVPDGDGRVLPCRSWGLIWPGAEVLDGDGRVLPGGGWAGWWWSCSLGVEDDEAGIAMEDNQDSDSK
jgi:hypothetical protein